MRFLLIALVATLGCLAIAVCLAAEPETAEASSSQFATHRKDFVMPKLFDFETFKQKFHRSYPNAIEHMRRAKVFMARAWAVFISAVKYMHRRSTKFLKINPHSDWTNEERDAIMNDGRRPGSSQASGDDSPFPAAEPEQIERLLAEIEAHKAEDPDFAAIAAELEKGQRHAAENSADVKSERQLSMEQLMGSNELESQVQCKTSHDCEAIGEAAGEQLKPISKDEAAQIDKPTGNYLFSVLGSIKDTATSYFTNSDQREETAVYKLNQGDNVQNWKAGARNGLPDGVFLDYRTSGCLVQPKNQRNCGACYVFGIMTMFEYQYCKQTGELVPFSEQYVVDCGPRTGLKGCQGGLVIEVAKFVNTFGLERSMDYAYKAKQQECPYDQNISPHEMGHVKLVKNGIQYIGKLSLLTPVNIVYLLRRYGPVGIGIRTTQEFHDFGGGVDILNCDPKKLTGHAMVIIGYGREDGLDYWLIRNSFGVSYGLEGHYKLHIDVPAGCLTGIEYADMTFRWNNQWRGQTVFDELKKRNLLARYAQSSIDQPAEQQGR